MNDSAVPPQAVAMPPLSHSIFDETFSTSGASQAVARPLLSRPVFDENISTSSCLPPKRPKLDWDEKRRTILVKEASQQKYTSEQMSESR